MEFTLIPDLNIVVLPFNHRNSNKFVNHKKIQHWEKSNYILNYYWYN